MVQEEEVSEEPSLRALCSLDDLRLRYLIFLGPGFFFKNVVKVQLICNVVFSFFLCSRMTVQKIYIFIFFFIMACHGVLSIVPAVQQDLVDYPSCIQEFASAKIRLSSLPCLPPSTLATTSVLYICVSVFVLQICHFVLYFTFHI